MTGPRPGAVAGVTAATAALALLLTLPAAGQPARAPGGPGAALVLLVVGVLAGTLQVHVRHRHRTTEAADLFWVAVAVAAVALPPVALVLVAAGGKVVSQLVLRVDPVKTLFNTAMTAASAAAVATTLDLLPRRWSLMPALALGLLAGWVVNHVAFVAVVSAAGVRSEVVSWRALGRWAAHGATTSALGILLAVAYSTDHSTILLFVVPALVLHAAGRALFSAAGERRRLSAGVEASRVLSGASRVDLGAYCRAVAAAYGSVEACLVTEPGAAPVVVGTAGTPTWLATLLDRLVDDEPRSLRLDSGPVSEVLAVRLPGRPGTLLAVAEPTGARERLPTELAFLSSSAGEVEAFLQAEDLRALAEARLSRLETVVAAVADGIVTVDADGRVLAVNAAGSAMTGRDDAAPTSGFPLADLRLLDPEGQPWSPDVSGGTTASRVQVDAGPAGVRVLDVSVAPAVLDDAPGAVLVLRDVTAAVERDRDRRRFLAGLGHELRTPLTPLLGWAQTLRRRPEILDGPVRDVVIDALGSQSQRLARLVDNLLTAVDPQAMVSRRRPVDLVELARREVDVAAEVLGPRQVRVVADGPLEVTSSPAALSHIVGNLLANVARYVPESGSALVVLRDDGDAAVLTVVDDGPGVPRESREAVFELFTHATGGEANPGAGVGLATSRSLARALGGDLVCVDPTDERLPERPPDRLPVPRGAARPGAAFRLTLPVAPSAPAPVPTHLSEQLFA